MQPSSAALRGLRARDRRAARGNGGGGCPASKPRPCEDRDAALRRLRDHGSRRRFPISRRKAEALEQQSEEARRRRGAHRACGVPGRRLRGAAPYADALTDLDRRAGPRGARGAGANAETGVASLARPARGLSRAARACAGHRPVRGERGGLGAFLETQLNVCSVERARATITRPVLSRAGAAVDQVAFDAALPGIAGLPRTATLPRCRNWTGRHARGVEAQDAIDQLTQRSRRMRPTHVLWTLVKILAFVAAVMAMTWGPSCSGGRGGRYVTMAGSRSPSPPCRWSSPR